MSAGTRWGVSLPGQLAPAPSPCLPGQVGPTQRPPSRGPFFCFKAPRLPSALTCPGGSRTDGSKLHSPQASLCPRLGALDVERGLSCLLAAGGGAGACLPCISSQMPGESWPKVALRVLPSRCWSEAGPCISRLQTHGRVNQLHCKSSRHGAQTLCTWPVSIHQSSSFTHLPLMHFRMSLGNTL